MLYLCYRGRVYVLFNAWLTEATFDAIEEFDFNERLCEGLRCTYTTRDIQGEELGQVIVSFTFNRDTSIFTARSMQWK